MKTLHLWFWMFQTPHTQTLVELIYFRLGDGLRWIESFVIAFEERGRHWRSARISYWTAARLRKGTETETISADRTAAVPTSWDPVAERRESDSLSLQNWLWTGTLPRRDRTGVRCNWGTHLREVSLPVDRTIGPLFASLEKSIGMRNVLVVLTADHDVRSTREVHSKQQMPGGRIKENAFEIIQEALELRFGAGQWVLSTAGTSPYLNYDLMKQRKLDPNDVIKIAARAIAQAPHVMRVYTRDRLISRLAGADVFDARVIRSFCAKRSGDLEVVLEPYWIWGGISGTTHGAPYDYDTHIPLIFMGTGIQAGRYYRSAALNDLAPTLAALLDVEIRSGSVWRVLDEMIQ